MLYYHAENTGTGGGDTSAILCCGNVQIVDITSTGIISGKQQLPNTVPSEAVILEGTADNNNVTIHFIAETNNAQSPEVSVDGIMCTNLQQFPDDRRLFYGSVDISVVSSRMITVASNTGKFAYTTIVRGASAPEVLSVIFTGGYPGSQTEVKEDDAITVQITFSPSGSEPTHVEVLNSGACKSTTINLSSTELNQGTVHTATFNTTARFAGNTAILRPVTIRTRNSIGSWSGNYISSTYGSINGTHLMNGCDLRPSFIQGSITFPTGQTAFKGTEPGTIDIIINNFNTLSYSSPNGDFNISNINTYVQNKPIICNNPGNYNDTINNFRIVANRSNNATTNIFNTIIEVADVAATVNVYHTESALRSSVTGEDYTIYANSNQNLASTPVMVVTIPISGTWQGLFTGSDKVWQNTIRILDSDVKGTGNQLQSITPTNNAGIPANITGSETVAGFLEHILPVAPFGTDATLPTAITSILNVTFTQSFKPAMAFYPIGSTAPVVGGWTIDALNTNPTQVIILDTAAASSSSQASTITIQEVV